MTKNTTDTAIPRIAFITIGQAPRDDVVPEISEMVDRPMDCTEYGALDGCSAADIVQNAPSSDDESLYTRLSDGTHVTVSSAFVEARLQEVIQRVDEVGHDLIVIITTGVFRPFRTRTPLIIGQRLVDAWIDSLIMDDDRIGIIYPLVRQIAERDMRGHATAIRKPRTHAAKGQSESLEEAAEQLKGCDLVLMHSVGYSEAMARHMASLSMVPVVTARRVIAGAIRLQLMQLAEVHETSPSDLVGQMPVNDAPLTKREHEVVTLVLDGLSNKLIARQLGISYRTVEIHRGRAFGKLGVSSAADLIRRILLQTRG